MNKNIILILVSLWWGWTVIIDFTVVPTVFHVIHSFFNAGELGIALFSKLNILEIVVSTLLTGLCLYEVKVLGHGRIQVTLLICAWAIVLVYLTYLTPKISYLTTLWQEAELKNAIGIKGIADIQQEHQFYHNIYVGLDSIKLLLITTVLGLNAKA